MKYLIFFLIVFNTYSQDIKDDQIENSCIDKNLENNADNEIWFDYIHALTPKLYNKCWKLDKSLEILDDKNIYLFFSLLKIKDYILLDITDKEIENNYLIYILDLENYVNSNTFIDALNALKEKLKLNLELKNCEFLKERICFIETL